MLLSEMYDELENLGGFTTDIEELSQEQIDFLEENDEYEIGIEDLLDIINDYSFNGAEICGLYNSVEELAENTLAELYDIPDNIVSYFDFEKFGNDLLMEEGYCELYDGRVAYIAF